MPILWAALAGIVAVAMIVVIIASQLNKRQMAHRRNMQNLVRGRVATPDVNDAIDDQAAIKIGPASIDIIETADLITRLQAITRIANGTTNTKAQDKEDAMVRRAERGHQKLVAEIERFNRDGQPRTRPSGPCELLIRYIDAEGVMTTRKVAPYRSGNTNEKFDAWCETRQDRRTFYFSRVQSGELLRSRQPLDRAGVFLHVHPGRRVPVELR